MVIVYSQRMGTLRRPKVSWIRRKDKRPLGWEDDQQQHYCNKQPAKIRWPLLLLSRIARQSVQLPTLMLKIIEMLQDENECTKKRELHLAGQSTAFKWCTNCQERTNWWEHTEKDKKRKRTECELSIIWEMIIDWKNQLRGTQMRKR